MRKIPFLLLGVIPLSCHANLGDTEGQLMQRFGAPALNHKELVRVQGKFMELGSILSFKVGDRQISCHLVEGLCALEHYHQKSDWTEEQIQQALTNNRQTGKWTETTDPAVKKTRRDWKRDDGATAIWQRGAGFTATHPSYTLAKQRAEDKAKDH